MYRVSVDIGGSFSDFVLLNEASGEIKTLKVLSRPDQPGAEVIEGMKILAEREGVDPRAVTYFTHGTTVGVNAVIERKGAALGLLTTRRFEEVLELARLKTADMYNLLSRRPTPLIPRRRVFGVDERTGADGGEILPLDENSVKQAVLAAVAAGCEGLVIAFLHSYRDPAHERRAKHIAAQTAPGLPVYCSSEIWPIIREYERTITAVIAGYVQPRIESYLSSLQAALSEIRVGSELRVTKSNGGVMTAEAAKSRCLEMILSGTASGVIGASHIARLCELDRCLSLDVGGTSADVALIANGEPRFGVGEFIGEFQVFAPSISVSSIGDGGGSVAWVDQHGVLKVGPDSAGSSPGPACYGRGGVRPTITDAFVANGWIGESALGYDAVKIDRDAAIRAVSGLAERLGSTAHETAAAIIDIAVSSMYSGVSAVVARHGVDPRRFSLLAFGGAGPMVANFLARELGVGHIVVPATPGVLSAFGGLIADLKNDFVRTVYCDLSEATMTQLASAALELRARGESWLREEQGYDGAAQFSLSAEMRYRGQSFELETPLDESWLARREVNAVAEAFHAQHRRVYGHADPNAEIQVVALRTVASGRTPKPRLPLLQEAEGVPKIERRVEVWADGAWREAQLLRRAVLRPGHRVQGPAVVAQPDCTTCILPGHAASIDDYGNMHIRREH